MSKRSYPICIAIIAVCFLYSGSAYMSECYRLMAFYPDVFVDIVSSVWFYLLQAAGIAAFMAGFAKKPELFGSMRLFAVLLVTGSTCMAVSQLSGSGPAIILFSCLFNLHVGMYFGFYLTLLAAHAPLGRAGFGFGAAYAAGSVGTYCLSLVGDGNLLVSRQVTATYFILAALTVALVLAAAPIEPAGTHPCDEVRHGHAALLLVIIAIMTVISVTGSGMYYSLPIADNVDWNLIRAFYAIGLVLAGLIMDRNRFIGEICSAASLAYPLVVAAIVGEGATGTVALGLGYAFRGFITIYYVIAFTDLAHDMPALLALAPAGLACSRVVEAALSWVLLVASPAPIFQLIFAAICFIPLLIAFVTLQSKRYAAPELSDDRRMAAFGEKHALTAREMEVLGYLAQGLSDAEIAGRAFISRSTVRFHVSNILKKTGAASRTEAVRMLNLL